MKKTLILGLEDGVLVFLIREDFRVWLMCVSMFCVFLLLFSHSYKDT